MIKLFKRASSIGALSLGFALAAPAVAAPTFPVAYGNTTVTLSSELVGALTTLGVTPAAIGYSRLRDGKINFPITDGDLDFGTAKGEITHAGGLKLSKGSTVVELRDFLIDTSGAAPIITGKVVANDSFVGRVPLFELTLPALALPLPTNNPYLTIPGVKVALSKTAADALNAIFGVTAFAQGIPVGTAQVQTFAFIRH